MTPALRIIDANANRAREALRVLEDIARFVLNDSDLAAALKNARHDLKSAMDALPVDRAAVLAWRDTPADVGTGLTTPGEGRRESLGDVAAAAGARLSEAIRSLEESAKLLAGPPDPAASAFERLRYAAYELERRVLVQVQTCGTPQWRLCVLVTESLCEGRTREEVAAAAMAGGADCIQLREKELPCSRLLAAARSLRDLTRAHGAALVVNDRVDIALLSAADGVHLGREDLPVREARRLAGRRLLIGTSTSSVSEARAGAVEGADYVGIGPMFPTCTKHRPQIAGPGSLRAVLADPLAARIPHLAIGGVSPRNVGELAAAGARGVAVCAAVCAAPDPGAVCREILAALAPRR